MVSKYIYKLTDATKINRNFNGFIKEKLKMAFEIS